MGSAPALSRWPLTGRDDLLAEVVDDLAGQGRAAVLLRGPAGIGKSRLAEEAARRLPRWLRVLRVQATTALAGIPLGALAELLGHPDATPEVVGPRTGDEVDLSLLDGPQLMRRVRQLLQVPDQDRRLVLLVDDVGQLDSLSLSVVVALLQARAAMLLATSRDDGPVPDGLSGMWSAGEAAQVQVPPLDPETCRALVAVGLNGQVAAQAGAALFRSSGGNPLHLRELVAETQRQGGFRQVQGVWRLTGAVVGSPALVDLVQRRLAALPADRRDVLERIALCQPLDVDEVVAAAGVGVEVVAELEQDGLVVVEGGFLEGLRVRIAHPQYEAVIRSSISRLRANLLIAAQLDAITPDRKRADDVRTALWSLTALGTADPELLLRGARLARLGHDFPAVRRLCAAAIQSAPNPSGDGSWSGEAELRLLAGEAERELGYPALAAQLLLLAATLPATSGTAARVAIARAVLEVDEGTHRLPAALALLDDALLRHPDQAAVLLGARAGLLAPTNAVGEGLRALEAAALVDGHQDAWSAVGAQLLANAGRVKEALAWSEPHVDFAPAGARVGLSDHRPDQHPDSHIESASAPLHPTEAALGRAWALLAGGRYDDAVAASRRALTLAVGDGLDRTVTTAEWQLAAALLHAGLPRTAARWCADVISAAEAVGPRRHVVSGLAGLSVARSWLGQASEAASTLDRLPADAAEDNPWVVLARAWVWHAEGSTRRAVQHLVDAAQAAAEGGNGAVCTALLQGVVRLGQAELVVDLAEQVADHAVAGGPAPVLSVRARHARAAADRDTAALGEVADTWSAMGARLEAAEAAAQAVQIAQTLSGPRAARHVATLSARLHELRGRCEGAVLTTLVTSGAAPLTARERQIALLAARGMPSQAIATRLVVSVRTVNNHLQASYLKLGISSRRELTHALFPDNSLDELM